MWISLPANNLIQGANSLKIWSQDEDVGNILSIRITQSDMAGQIRSTINDDGTIVGSIKGRLIAAPTEAAEAAILTEQTARITSDSVLVTDAITLSGRVDTAEGTIITNKTIAADATGVVILDVNTLAGRVGTTEGLITTNKTIAANATSAVASDVTAIQTTIGDRTASVQTIAESIDGIEAKYAIKVQARDSDDKLVMAGVELLADGSTGTSEILMEANSFKLVLPGGEGDPVVPFTATADVYGNSIINMNASITIGTKTLSQIQSDAEDGASFTEDTWLGTTIDFAKLGATVVDGAYIKTSLIKTDAILIGDLSGAGALAGLNTVSNSYITSIDGGKITTGFVSASRINVDDLFAETITVNAGGSIGSDNYVSGSTGWTINSSGNAEFNDVTIQGSLKGVDITSAAGLVVDTSGGIVVNDGASIDLNGTGSSIGFDEGFLYCGSSSFKVYSVAGSWLELHGEAGITLSAGTGYNVTCYEDIVPDSNTARNLGSTSKYWDTGYIDKINLGDNDLDRYEEGSYTPTLKIGTTTISLESSYNSLSYTIIGRQVTITGSIRVSSASSSGAISLTLPVSAALGGLTELSEYFVGSVYHSGMDAFTDTGNLKVVNSVLSSYVYIVEQTLLGMNSLIGDKVSSSTEFQFSFSYFTS